MSKVNEFKLLKGFVFKNVGTHLLDGILEQRRLFRLQNRVRELENEQRILSGGESMHYDVALRTILGNNERV
jgi:hypothetical protein